jgi:isopentenyl-diphosphate delta-isomerase
MSRTTSPTETPDPIPPTKELRASVREPLASDGLKPKLVMSNGHGRTTVKRKGDHIRINLEEDVSAKISAGFEKFRFVHRALPEVDLAQVTTATALFGRPLGAPLLISSMTGGTDAARSINRTLAEVAQEFRLAMGLGSGRVLIEHPELLSTFAIRSIAPDALLFANLGAVQLNRGVTVARCRWLLDQLEADGLILHFNALQEALQPEGDTCFGNLLGRVEELCHALDRPVIAKEVGWGIAPDMVRALLDAGVTAVDVAGAGGTSWSEVEKHRIKEPWRAGVASAFADWGLPTAEALQLARAAAPHAPIFASGGIKNGLDLAKAVALGADLVGIAGPFLRRAATGVPATRELAQELIETLRIAMFCVGARNIAELRGTTRLQRLGQAAPQPHTDRLQFRTSANGQFLDITDDVTQVVRQSGIQSGVAHVFSNHTTVAIRINENEPLLLEDFSRMLNRLVPNGGYDHDDFDRRPGVPPDEPVNGHAHCRHLLLSSSETIPVIDGRPALGTWQRIFLVELCSPRDRTVTVQVMGA